MNETIKEKSWIPLILMHVKSSLSKVSIKNAFISNGKFLFSSKKLKIIF